MTTAKADESSWYNWPIPVTIVLVILKLAGFADISWWLVFSPLIVASIVVVGGFVLLFLFLAIMDDDDRFL